MFKVAAILKQFKQLCPQLISTNIFEQNLCANVFFNWSKRLVAIEFKLAQTHTHKRTMLFDIPKYEDIARSSNECSVDICKLIDSSE